MHVDDLLFKSFLNKISNQLVEAIDPKEVKIETINLPESEKKDRIEGFLARKVIAWPQVYNITLSHDNPIEDKVYKLLNSVKHRDYSKEEDETNKVFEKCILKKNILIT
jgi:hypothetical protein